MKKSNYPQFNQILTINKDGRHEYISTGSTLNSQNYISLPTILGMYNTTDPTLRKYLKENGTEETDYFLADGRLYIQEQFLSKNHFYLKPSYKSTFHPYRKERIVGSKIPYTITTKHLSIEEKVKVFKTKKIKAGVRQLILSELKKVNWDYFITINTKHFTSQDDWDLMMLNFMDKLGLHLNNSDIKACYATEYSIKDTDQRKSKYESQHRHIHILLCRQNEHIKLQTIKELILETMGRKKFNKDEYHLCMYDKSLWATNYILKEYNINKSCFSMVSPNKELFISTN